MLLPVVKTVPGMLSKSRAVASSLVYSHRVISPAPTSVTLVTGWVTVTVSCPEPAPRSLSVTVTRTVFVAAAEYVCVTVIAPVWLVVLPVADEASPQSTEYAHGASFTPGSLNVALSVMAVPTATVWLAPAFTVGATFVMVAVVVAGELAVPRESGTVGRPVGLAWGTWVCVGLTP